MDESSKRFKVINPVSPISTERKYKRKTAAIMSADVKGYSKLMGKNEELTVSTITAYRQVFYKLVSEFNGRVVDSPGDNILSEFQDAVNAVSCALAIQKEIDSRNHNLEKSVRMRFRIGINYGDVIEDQGRLYGDGVNIAARLESLAEGGGICISGTVNDQINNSLSVGVAYLGSQSVKNIKRPVKTYKILTTKKDRVIKREFVALSYFIISIAALYIFYYMHIRFILADNLLMPFLILNFSELVVTFLILSVPPAILGVVFIVLIIINKGIDTRSLRILRSFFSWGLATFLVIIVFSNLPEDYQLGANEIIYSASHTFVINKGSETTLFNNRDKDSDQIYKSYSGTTFMLFDTKQTKLEKWNQIRLEKNNSGWLINEEPNSLSIFYYSFKLSDAIGLLLGFVFAIISWRMKSL
jgi:class 3 adenylate cyclase